MVTELKLNNIVCLGCTRDIHSVFNGIQGIYGIKIDIAKDTIEVSHTEELTKEELLKVVLEKIKERSK